VLQLLGSHYSTVSCLRWPSTDEKHSHANGGSRIAMAASPTSSAAAVPGGDNHTARSGRTYDVRGFHSYSNAQLTATTSSCTVSTTITDEGSSAQRSMSALYGHCMLYDASEVVSRSTSVVELSCL